jgi:hypothetical protein
MAIVFVGIDLAKNVFAVHAQYAVNIRMNASNTLIPSRCEQTMAPSQKRPQKVPTAMNAAMAQDRRFSYHFTVGTLARSAYKKALEQGSRSDLVCACDLFVWPGGLMQIEPCCFQAATPRRH